jgi:transcription initiation factor TFIIIB Brf1 subunit/transcription initiation factor TFIIB
LNKYTISEYIKHISNDLYLKVVDKNEILRGNSRMGLIFAIVYTCYKNSSTPKTQDEVNEIFQMEKKVISEGIKILKLKMFEKNIKISMSGKDKKFNMYISSIMNKLNSNNSNKQAVYKLYEQIKDRDSIFNSSKPRSVVSSLIYYYCKKNGNNISISEFSELVGLSVITISKLSKKINDVLETDIKL